MIGVFNFVVIAFLKILLTTCNDKLRIKLIKWQLAYAKLDVGVKMQATFGQS